MPCALPIRSEEHTSELQSHDNLVCRLLLEKKQNAGHAAAGIGYHAHGGDDRCRGSARAWRGWTERGVASRTCVGATCDRLCIFFLKNRAPPKFSPFPPHAPFRS